jgi:V8-like Glu-specific endopeptidase
MYKTLLLRCAVVALLCMLALSVALIRLSQQTHAAPAISSGSSNVITSTVTTVASSTLAYWTTARMKAARSADKLLVKGAIHPSGPPTSSGTPALLDPVLPETEAGRPATTSGGQMQAQASPVPSPYTFPYSTVGKVFFTDPQTNADYVCSGTAIASRNGSTIDTAGHCVANGGHNYFYTHWAFCAQYYNGCNTKYLWAARKLLTHSNWYQRGWLTYDYGEAVVSANASGNVISVVGGAGVAYNQPYQQHYTALGYPQAAPYDGTQLEECQSDLYQRDQPNPNGASTLSITCDMTGGSSGGGWLISEQGKFGYLNGHNDYKYNNDEAHMYSPYYGNDWYSIYRSAQSS